MRIAVESLLAAHADAGDFLEGSALDLAPPPTSTSIDYSTSEVRIGAYRVVRGIGHGGMGTVYLAERNDDQYHKRVAIKVVSPGLDTDLIIRRFRHERQMLANLDHPNIARLLDGGTDAEGLPYFVMEYIEGEPITRYCITRGLALPERLDLFRKVCAAVHYAHQRLVVHCDIKPGNILITDEGVPKLLDFGIARLLEVAGDASPAPPRAMTLEYASPEQLSGTAVTTLTDVYSLGVVLYELICGQQPYGTGAFTFTIAAGKAETVRTKTLPEPPSSVAMRVGTAHPATSPRWKLFGHRKLRRGLHPDLDCIALKALHPTAQRRYASAQQLSEDVRLYLEQRPIRARPGNLIHRSTLRIRRNALLSMAGATLAVALFGGISTITWQAHIADQQRRTAERRFNDVRSLATSLMSDVNDSIASLPGTTRARSLIVARALGALDTLSRDAHGDSGLQYDLAVGYLKAGDIQGRPYGPNLGETHAALTSYDKARVILASLVAAHPRNIEAQAELALAEQRLGAIYLRARDWANGERHERLSVALGDRLVRLDPAGERSQIELSDALIYLGDALAASDDQWSASRIRAARASYSRGLNIRLALAARGPMSPALQRALISAYNRIGYTGSSLWKVTGDIGELRGALVNHTESQRLRLRLFSADRGSSVNRRLVADGWMDIAQVQGELGDARGALRTLDTAGPMFQALADADRENVEARRDLAYYHENIGAALADAGQSSRAIRHERLAVAMLLELQRGDAASNEEYFHIAHAHETTARAFEALGSRVLALKSYGDVETILRRWMITDPNNARADRMLREAGDRMAALRKAPDRGG
ncbi:MAG: serine/threonine protein kinase [Gemmatimonadota bacterium]|nr:serine/threonine protein kinase [Gemmatimonadota bacterium]